jgi:hypothetical protein
MSAKAAGKTIVVTIRCARSFHLRLGRDAKRVKLYSHVISFNSNAGCERPEVTLSMSAAETISRGGCHCGRVAFEVEGRPERVDECNCSICTKKGYLHWIVPRESFQLLTPAENVSTYTFNTGVAKHHFCPNCGVAAFYIPRSDPDKIDVNARCLDGVELAGLKVERFDGRNWEEAIKDHRAAR